MKAQEMVDHMVDGYLNKGVERIRPTLESFERYVVCCCHRKVGDFHFSQPLVASYLHG